MSYSRDTQLFWELLDLSDAELMIDNDMCIISYNFTYNDDEDQESESQAFDFGPKDLAWLFGEKLGIYMTEA
jgi:hypothetical protein